MRGFVTVHQLANRTGLTREAIYKRIRNNSGFKGKYTKKSGGRLVISDSGCRMLVGNRRQHVVNELLIGRQLRYYKQQLAYKDNQIKVKDRQALRKDEQIAEFQKQLSRSQVLLDRSQEIQLSMQNHYQKLLASKSVSDSDSRGGWLKRFFAKIFK